MAGEIPSGFVSVLALMVSVLERPLEWMVSLYYAVQTYTQTHRHAHRRLNRTLTAFSLE